MRPDVRRAPTWRVIISIPPVTMAISLMGLAGYFPNSKFLGSQILFWLQVAIWTLGGTEWLKYSIKHTERKKDD